MKIIVELDTNQLHYIRGLLRRELDETKVDKDRGEYFKEYHQSIEDILNQFK